MHSGLYDYFGKEEAEKFGDLIVKKLAGKKISKRMDAAEGPGGLIYEAQQLGIDMWELLRALEGMCTTGQAKEIDDSTYLVKDPSFNFSQYKANRDAVKSSRTVTAGTWVYNLEAGPKIRRAINDEDVAGILRGLIDGYDELFAQGYIDEYDHDSWTADVADLLDDVESYRYPEDLLDEFEDEVDFQLDEFYDLCDNLRVWVAFEHNL